VAIVEWCLQHGVLYIDPSIEHWGTNQDEVIPDLAARTLYASHVELRAMAEAYPNSATCIVAHGANPGLVSHLAKAALLKVAQDTGLEVMEPSSREEWAALAEATGTRVIQIAERDTQILRAPKRIHEFVNTWSCEGFWCEGRAPSEFGWGSHEIIKPEGLTLQGEGCAFLDEPGVAVLVKSWVPKGGTFNGFLVQHSESLMLSEYLSSDSYRPTVFYAYQPTDAAIASIHEMRGQELWLHRNTRVAKNSILSGTDELGVLLLGHKKNALWYGSQLDIGEARRLIPGQNATTVQVVASMLGAIVWTLQNPKRGYCEPEDLPFDFVLNIAKPYLGPLAAVYSDWNPLDNRGHLYKKEYDEDNEWSFVNFIIGK
jgi:homospermidine synthase